MRANIVVLTVRLCPRGILNLVVPRQLMGSRATLWRFGSIVAGFLINFEFLPLGIGGTADLAAGLPSSQLCLLFD